MEIVVISKENDNLIEPQNVIEKTIEVDSNISVIEVSNEGSSVIEVINNSTNSTIEVITEESSTVEVITLGKPVIEVTSGSKGDSAYQVWLDQGNNGSQQDFLDSLKGEPGATISGDSAYEAALDGGYVGTESQFNSDLAQVGNKQPLNITSQPTGTLSNSDLFSFWSYINSIRKIISWENIKVTLKTYFDTIYQSKLISGTNIKTINGGTVLGSGNLSLEPAKGSNDNYVTDSEKSNLHAPHSDDQLRFVEEPTRTVILAANNVEGIAINNTSTIIRNPATDEEGFVLGAYSNSIMTPDNEAGLDVTDTQIILNLDTTVEGDITADNLSGDNSGDQFGDGVTITGSGTQADPFVAVVPPAGYEHEYDVHSSTPTTTKYIGIAPLGTLKSATGWTITKIVITTAGAVTTTHATGIYDNRESLIYS